MPSITLTDPVTATTVASGLIATNNANLRNLLNAGLDYANLKGAPALRTNDVPVWNGTQFVIPGGTPSSSTFLRGDGSWAVAGSMIQICDLSLSASQATFDTNTILGGNIPQTYKHLKLVMQHRVDVVGPGGQIRFNNDGSTNYSYYQMYGQNATPVSAATTGSTGFGVLLTPGTTDTAGRFGSCEALIPNYTSSTANNSISVVGGGVQQTNTYTGTWFGYRTTDTNPVTRIQVLVNAAGNFVAGSRFTLYGIT